MTQELLINVGAAETRVAVVENGRLEGLSTARTLGGEASDGLVGEIILGRVVRVLPAVQAAFVEIGRERAGFLGAREARSLAPDRTDEPAIAELVREGDKLLVQIIKDPIGDKGARLTAGVTVPGRLCVLTPFQSLVTLSRRIEDEAERARLLAVGETLRADGILACGCIFRTAALGATLDAIREDVLRLRREWDAIAAAGASAPVPAILHHDLDPVTRALRDVVHAEIARVLIDDAAAAERARAFCRRAMPEVADRIVLFAGPGGLFDDLEADIDGLMHPRVPLPSGAWITIEGTEALTAVDVNSGGFISAAGLEDTGLAVDLEAAGEIGRQIRLRGIGGLIVVDFIHLKEPEHVERVLQALSHSLARDGVPVTVGPLSPFGLVEITRKRVREPLVALAGEECSACGGLGLVRRPDMVAMDIVRRVEASARAAPGKPVEVRAAPEVVRRLEGEALTAALARKGVARLELKADETCSRDRFDVSTHP